MSRQKVVFLCVCVHQHTVMVVTSQRYTGTKQKFNAPFYGSRFQKGYHLVTRLHDYAHYELINGNTYLTVKRELNSSRSLKIA